MKSYQNILQTATNSAFVEVGSYSGAELGFNAKKITTKVGDMVVPFVKASIALRMPKDVTSCSTPACVIGTVTESFKCEFNITDVTSLDVLKAEIDRVFALTKVALAHGVLPPVSATFADA